MTGPLASTSSPRPPPPLGVFPGSRRRGSGSERDVDASGVSAFEDAVGRKVAWVVFSDEWCLDAEESANERCDPSRIDARFPADTARWIVARGSTPWIRLMLRSTTAQGRREETFTLERIARGDFDAELRAWCRDAGALDAPIFAEWGTEMNGGVFPWSARRHGASDEATAPFRAAFRRVVSACRDEGARRLRWVFHLDVEDDPDVAWNRFERYWPGDDVVDVVGVSVYGAQTPFEARCPPFADRFAATYARIARLAPGKPVAIAELGVAKGNPSCDQAAWTDAALSAIAGGRWPALAGVVWWNDSWPNDARREHDTTMRVEDSPALAATLRRHFGGS